MDKGRGFGKVILFNEHFVVHGIPAIVSGIGDFTAAEVSTPDKDGEDCPIKAGSGLVIEDNRPATPDYKKEKEKDQKESIERMLNAVNLDPKMDLFIRLSGPLYAASGVGASAASCAAIARALGNHFGQSLTDERVNKIAFEGEKGYHATPSGIDNSAATYGGLLWFEKTEGQPKLEPIKLTEPVEIVMGNTGIVADTKAAVKGVEDRKKAQPDKYEGLFTQARKLAPIAREALESQNLKIAGELMIENHRLLQEIEVSHQKLDYLVELAIMEGALGAKLTGGGHGGYMLALTPGKELQDKVAGAIEADGYTVLKTTIG